MQKLPLNSALQDRECIKRSLEWLYQDEGCSGLLAGDSQICKCLLGARGEALWQRAPPAHGVHTSVLELPFLCHSAQFSLCGGLLHIECNCIDLQSEDRVKSQAHVSIFATCSWSSLTLTDTKAILW